jgi:hypothetical protein
VHAAALRSVAAACASTALNNGQWTRDLPGWM